MDERMDEPCPFCGNKVTYPDHRDGTIREVYQYCPNCGAQGPNVYQHHRSMDFCESEARMLWNRRAQ